MDDFQVPEWHDSSLNETKTGEAVSVEQAIEGDLSVQSESADALTDEKNEKADCSEDESDSVITADKDLEDDLKDQAECTRDEDNKVLTALCGLEEKLDELNKLFSQRIQRTDFEEKVIDQMHSELQKYKDDMYAQLVRPILLDLIDIRESIRRVSDNYACKPEDEQVIPLKTFSDYTFDLLDALEKNNVTVSDSKEGDSYVPLKHRVVKKVTTPVEELHGKIAESLSSGYEYCGKTISPERVVVYIYQKTETTEGE